MRLRKAATNHSIKAHTKRPKLIWEPIMTCSVSDGCPIVGEVRHPDSIVFAVNLYYNYVRWGDSLSAAEGNAIHSRSVNAANWMFFEIPSLLAEHWRQTLIDELTKTTRSYQINTFDNLFVNQCRSTWYVCVAWAPAALEVALDVCYLCTI